MPRWRPPATSTRTASSISSSDAGAPGQFALSDGRGRFTVSAADPLTSPAHAAQFVDYDNDGLLDLLVATPAGLRVFRNLGSRWMDVSAKAGGLGGTPAADGRASQPATSMAMETPMRSCAPAGVRFLRNQGGNRNRSVRVQPRREGQQSQRRGAKIEMRAGSLRQRLETYSATPAPAPADISFGLGDRAGADVIRCCGLPGSSRPKRHPSRRRPRRSPASSRSRSWIASHPRARSCSRGTASAFEFLTDFLGGGEMGYWLAPGVRNTPDPDEYVRIAGSKLAPQDGRLDLRVTNELEEAVFLDRAELVSYRPSRGHRGLSERRIEAVAPSRYGCS